jgi:dipeptidyl aminopeptidase/acylaminoacyl peptidase
MDDQFAASGLKGMEHNGAGSPESLLLGKQITLIPEQVKKSNPENYISKDDPPFYIQHGAIDPIIPVQQSIHFADSLKKITGAGKVTLELLKDEAHGSAGFWTTGNINKILTVVDKYIN